MKKRIGLCFIAFVICMCLACAHAETIKMKQVYVPEKQVSIAFPEEYITCEKEDTDLDPRLAAKGITLAGVKSLFSQDGGFFIYAFPPDFDGDVNVTIADTAGLSSFAKLDRTALDMLKDTYGKQISGLGGELLSIEDVQIGDNLFFVIKTHKTAQNMDCFQYVTIVDEQAITITLTRSAITEEVEDMLRQMVEASTFNKHAAEAAGSKNASRASGGENVNTGLEYYDEELGIHIVIPDGWEQLNMSKERQTLRMKMGRIDEPYCMILYAANDLWGSLSAAQKTALGIITESDLDQLASNAEIMAAMLGKDKSEVELRTYAGKNYTMTTMTGDTPLGGTIDIFTATTIRDGYLVIYQLYDLTNKYPDSLDAVLENVYYD